ncbi:MAG: hypothetical protein INQ03_23915 [Candidatus Heimdallarchaeota archaeon]|nr:hypothetical protein [Candidatus Heimdallarchaeota archaeon]
MLKILISSNEKPTKIDDTEEYIKDVFDYFQHNGRIYTTRKQLDRELNFIFTTFYEFYRTNMLIR